MERNIICPKCGKLASWNSWFQSWYCPDCGYLKRKDEIQKEEKP